MRKRVLLITKRCVNAEALVRFWPQDNWDLCLYTYHKKEWFPGMAKQMGKKWIAHHSDFDNKGSGGGFPKGSQKQPGLKQTYRQKTRGLRKFIHHNLWRLYDQQLLKWALPSMRKTNSIAKQIQPDLVLSIYEPLASNLIARRIAALCRVPWIAYFRDHCTTYNELYRVPVLWQLQSTYDVHLHAPMDRLVGVSSQFVDILRKFYNVPADRSYVITGGFDDNDLPVAIRENCIQRRRRKLSPVAALANQPRRLLLSYVGALYGHRVEPLVVLLNALEVLKDKGIPCELQLVLNKASHFLPAWVHDKIERGKAQGLIQDFGSARIPHSQALKMTDAADVNLILEGMRPPHSTAGTITWKIFELMMIAKPAVAICAPSLPIGDYLREAGIGVDGNDVGSVVDRILEIWHWAHGGNPPNWYAPVEQAIEQYSFRGMAAKMNAVLEQTYAESIR